MSVKRTPSTVCRRCETERGLYRDRNLCSGERGQDESEKAQKQT